MSTRIPTDIFGRRLNLQRLPFTTIASRPTVEYDELFVNSKEDKMEGTLDMNRNKITNIKAPTKLLDAANKAYVDSLTQQISKALEEKFEDARTNIKLNRDQDKALKKFIKQLCTEVDSGTQIKQIRSKLANTKNIPTLVIPWDKGHTMTKNVVILQVLIESDNNCWLDIQSLGYQYGLHIYERYNKNIKKHELHISVTQMLPSQWKRNIIIFCRILH